MSVNRKQLYDLILKMTVSEKRYFKIYANRHVLGDENGYVLLFDIISEVIKRKEVYSELTLTKDLSINYHQMRKILQGMRKLFFQFVKNKNHLLSKSAAEMKKQFTTLLNDLQLLNGDSYSHLAFRSINFVQWVQEFTINLLVGRRRLRVLTKLVVLRALDFSNFNEIFK